MAFACCISKYQSVHGVPARTCKTASSWHQLWHQHLARWTRAGHRAIWTRVIRFCARHKPGAWFARFAHARFALRLRTREQRALALDSAAARTHRALSISSGHRSAYISCAWFWRASSSRMAWAPQPPRGNAARMPRFAQKRNRFRHRSRYRASRHETFLPGALTQAANRHNRWFMDISSLGSRVSGLRLAATRGLVSSSCELGQTRSNSRAPRCAATRTQRTARERHNKHLDMASITHWFAFYRCASPSAISWQRLTSCCRPRGFISTTAAYQFVARCIIRQQNIIAAQKSAWRWQHISINLSCATSPSTMKRANDMASAS